MNNQMFWETVNLAQCNPRLYKTWRDWMRYLRVTPWYELEHGLKGYFGCSQEQSDAWTDWRRSVELNDERILIDAKLAVAQKLTWEGKFPSRFQWLMDEGWEDPEAVCSYCGQHHT